MELEYKPDIEETLERYKMWWAREDFGRCAISITAQKPPSPNNPSVKIPADIKKRWLDFKYLEASYENRLKNHIFIAETLPICHLGSYPAWDWLPMFLGCGVILDEITAWANPIIEEGSLEDYDPADIKIDFENEWWLLSQKYHAFINKLSKNKSMPWPPVMGGCGDMLGAVRTTNKLLFDVIDTPEAVKNFEERLMTIFMETFEHYYNIHKNYCFGGSVNWLNMWAPGKNYMPQSDFSYMISTKMYEELFIGQLIRELDYLDYSIFHLDGIGSFKHVDLLCSLENLNGVQVLPGAGKPWPLYYMDVLKKVQAAGKNLQIHLPPEEVGAALDNLSSKGLFIHTWCDNEEEANDLLKLVENQSKFY